MNLSIEQAIGAQHQVSLQIVEKVKTTRGEPSVNRAAHLCGIAGNKVRSIRKALDDAGVNSFRLPSTNNRGLAVDILKVMCGRLKPVSPADLHAELGYEQTSIRSSLGNMNKSGAIKRVSYCTYVITVKGIKHVQKKVNVEVLPMVELRAKELKK